MLKNTVENEWSQANGTAEVVSSKREEALPVEYPKIGEETDGSKGKQKSKRYRRNRGKKKPSQSNLESESESRVGATSSPGPSRCEVDEETGRDKVDEETGKEGEQRPSAVRNKTKSYEKVKESDQAQLSSPTGKQSNHRSTIQSNLQSPCSQTPSPCSHTPSKGKSGGTPQSPRHSSNKKKNNKLYDEYWTKEQVSASLKRSEVHQGVLRISTKNYEMAWVGHAGFKRDIAVIGMYSRNRALNGDVVAIVILPREKWSVMSEELKYHEDHVEEAADKLLELKVTPDEGPNSVKHINGSKSPRKGGQRRIDIMKVPEKFLQRTARVVHIVEKKHPRVACGLLRPMAKQDDPDGLFSPTDIRLPRLRIPHHLCPPEFFQRPQDFEKTLLIARLTEWPREAARDSHFACGCFARSLGEAGEIEPETDGILMVNDIDSSPFTDQVLACLPKELPWTIPEEEEDIRRDFRDTCVFTIDPATARDLDDALHCNLLEDGMLEVGVHIADVSFFIEEGTELDQVAAERATSAYMVQKVIPMLPRLLCEELCSLNPGEDRLTFSVVWKMDKDGVIQDEWMGKGIIRSRVKLSYEHAQEMIDNPEKVWSDGEHPPLASGVSIGDVAKCVTRLQHIAVKLRRKRFENGTLQLDKAKISFDLDGKTGLPIGWHPYIQRESNKLIEEFMLLANMAVAHHIYDAFPDIALLRCHPKPDARQLEEVEALCNSLQITFSPKSSKDIQKSLNSFSSNSPEQLVLSLLAMKPMKAAKYFCSGSVEGDPEKFVHYALSVPLYTHFTSPIRRYPDVLVHRLLAASLKVGPELQSTAEALDVIATHCNDKKLAAKCAGEASVELYLGSFIRECGPLMEDGIVVTVKSEAVDILVPSLGIIKRVYYKYCENIKAYEFEERIKTRPAKVLITWKSPDDKKSSSDTTGLQTDSLTIFSSVHVLLMTENDKKKNKSGLRFVGELMPSPAMKH